MRRFVELLSGELSDEYPYYRTRIMPSVDLDHRDGRSTMDF